MALAEKQHNKCLNFKTGLGRLDVLPLKKAKTSDHCAQEQNLQFGIHITLHKSVVSRKCT